MDRNNGAPAIGTEVMLATDLLSVWWHSEREGTLPRQIIRHYAASLRQDAMRILK